LLLVTTLAAVSIFAVRSIPFFRPAIDALNAWCGRLVRLLGR
jgi:hypothetical protein